MNAQKTELKIEIDQRERRPVKISGVRRAEADKKSKKWGLVSPLRLMRIGCINVTTLLQPGHDVAAARTLAHYDVDICGLSEVRMANKGIKTIGK